MKTSELINLNDRELQEGVIFKELQIKEQAKNVKTELNKKFTIQNGEIKPKGWRMRLFWSFMKPILKPLLNLLILLLGQSIENIIDDK